MVLKQRKYGKLVPYNCRMRHTFYDPSAYFLAKPLIDWCFQRLSKQNQEICGMEAGNMPNDDPAKLSLATRNLGQPKLLDPVRNTFRMLHRQQRYQRIYDDARC